MKYSFKIMIMGHIFHSACKKMHDENLVRSQTLTEGGELCDFRYSLK